MNRLYKNTKSGKLFGICQGISEYANIDPTIIRIIFVIATLVSGGSALIAYLILALILDDKPTTPVE